MKVSILLSKQHLQLLLYGITCTEILFNVFIPAQSLRGNNFRNFLDPRVFSH